MGMYRNHLAKTDQLIKKSLANNINSNIKNNVVDGGETDKYKAFINDRIFKKVMRLYKKSI